MVPNAHTAPRCVESIVTPRVDNALEGNQDICILLSLGLQQCRNQKSLYYDTLIERERKKNEKKNETVPLPNLMDKPPQVEPQWGKGQGHGQRAEGKSNTSSASERTQTRSVSDQQ